jgi:hypothetical protein
MTKKDQIAFLREINDTVAEKIAERLEFLHKDREVIYDEL